KALNTEEPWSGGVPCQLESTGRPLPPRPPPPPRPKPVLRFAETETRADHPFGRLLIFDGGKFASSYRVKDKQILVVNRNMGKENMTITVLENDKNAEGLFLPRGYTVQYWDAATGELRRTETIQDRWQRLGNWDLPAVQTVTTASGAGFSVRGFTLSKHELMKKIDSKSDQGARVLGPSGIAYPAEAKKQGLEGRVLLLLSITAEGELSNVKIQESSGRKVLDDAALAYAKSLKFVPARKDSKPVATTALYPMLFQLAEKK